MIFFILLQSCTTVEVTKEVIKASSSMKTSVKDMISGREGDVEEIKDKNIQAEIEVEKESIDIEQKKEKSIVEKQQKTLQINFFGNSINEIKKLLGEPQLAREDGSTFMFRYDSESCRLFLFFNFNTIKKTVEYFELRDRKGILLESKKKMENCYNEFKLN